MILNENVLYLDYVYSKEMACQNVKVFDDTKKFNGLNNSREKTRG